MTHYYIDLAMFGAQWYLTLCIVGTVVREFVQEQGQDAVIVINLNGRSQ
jgi:hypothetical protein